MKNISFLVRKKITMEKFASQVKISTNSIVEKILGVNSQSIINSCDCLNGYVSLSGKIKANVIYENSEKTVDHAEIIFDFIEKQQINIEIDDVFAEDNLEVKNITFSGTEIICVFEHSTCLNGNYNYEISELLDEENNFVTQNEKFDSLKFVTSCEDNFVVAEEVEANLSNIAILNADAHAVINEVNCLVDRISIDGKIISNILYKDFNGIGLYLKEFEFKQEISANGVIPNMIVKGFTKIKNTNVTAEDNDGKTNLVYSFDFFAKGFVYEEATYGYIDDMFSLNNKIQTIYNFIDAREFSSTKNYSDTFMHSVDVSQIENFDDVLSVFLPKFLFENIEEQDEKSFLIGQIKSSALYRANNDLFVLETILPVKVEISKEKNEVIGNVDFIPEISSYKVKAGKNLEIVYSLNYSVNFEKEINVKYVKSFEIKEEKNDDNGGIKIYVTEKGEKLFDVAKSLNIRPELIKSQNNVGDVFEQGEKIYIYSPINLYN